MEIRKFLKDIEKKIIDIMPKNLKTVLSIVIQKVKGTEMKKKEDK